MKLSAFITAAAMAAACTARAAIVEVGNDPNAVNGGVDGWSSILVIDEDATYTNTSGANELATPVGFDFQVGNNRGRVTPFLARVNGNNAFTVVAVGKTRVSGADYSTTGVFEFDFSDAPTAIVLGPGESLAPGMTNANADGSGNGGSVIPFVSGHEIWLTGGSSPGNAGSVTAGNAPGGGSTTLTNLNRRYAYSIDVDVVPESVSPPTDIVYSGEQPLAGMGAGIALGSFAAVDPDVGDSHAFSLVSNPGGAFAISGATLETAVPAGAPGSSTTIRVRAEDAFADPFEKDFVLTVEAQVTPTGVTLSATEVNRLASGGAAIGVLDAVDGNGADQFTYAMVAGNGDGDNGLFFVDGSTLRIAAQVPQGQMSVSLRIRATDLAGQSVESEFVLPVVDPAIVISEFLASNSAGLLDEDGDSSDWIELRNDGNAAVDLAGWSLSDNDDNLTKWVFPSVTIGPGEYLVVFASGKDRAVPGGELHTNFQLSAAGEYVALVAPGGSVIADRYSNPGTQFPDIAYGRGTGGGAVGYLEPTPGAANGASTAEVSDEVAFSHARGAYAAAFSLTLSSPPGTQIRYTTNGTRPGGGTGLVYAGPIAISPPTAGSSRGVRTIRAVATGGTGLRTPVATHTYVFANEAANQSVFTSSITSHATYGPLIDDALVAQPIVSVVDAQGLPGNAERQTSIEFFDPDGGEPGFQIECGIKVVGGHSVGSAKNNFRLFFRGEYGASKLNYPLFAGHPYNSGAAEVFDRLNLRSGSHDTFFWLSNPSNPPNSGGPVKGDAQYLRNRWISDMQLRMGQPAMHGRWVQVFVNGAYHGQYQLLEHPNDDFHASYLGGTSEDYEFTNGANSSKTGSDHWQAVWAQVKSAASAGGATARQWVDFENLADYMLLNFYAGNPWDWNPNQNWMTGGPNQPGMGGWKFFGWDSDIIFQDPGANVTGKNVPDGLFQSLIGDPDFEVAFRDRVYRHCFHDGVLTPAEAQATFDARASELELSIVAETARWQGAAANPPWDRDGEWDAELDRMRTTFFPGRHATLVSQLRSRGWYPIDAPEFDQRGGEVSAGHQPVIAATSGTIYVTTDGSDPREQGGGVAASAQVFTAGSLTIGGATLVRARARSGNEWSAINEAAFVLSGTVSADATNLAVTEVNYHPANPSVDEINAGFSDDDDFEFVEVENISGDTIDLGGVRFTVGVVFGFPPATTLGPGERLVVVRNVAAFQHRYPGVPPASVAGAFFSPAGVSDDERLSNAGERIVLLDAGGGVIADFTYNDEDPWPKDADGEGSTLVLRQTGGAYADGLNWRASVAAGGTPTGSDSVPFPGGNVVAYALADPAVGMDFTDSGKVELAFHVNLAADDASLSIWHSPDLETWANVDADFKVDRRQNLGDGTVVMEFQTLDPVGDPRGFYLLRITVGL